MHGEMKQLAVGLALALAAMSSARAEAPPLSAPELSRCATQVQNLRAESLRLTQKNTEMEPRRRAINERSVALKAERDAVPADDMDRSLAVRQSLQEHHAQTVEFNTQVEQLKREIVAVNALKQDYDRDCANRPYRRSDLAALPDAQRSAMQVGLGGVQVPYLDPASTPGGADARP